MDLDRLYQILQETTVQLRKGPEVVESQVGHLHVTEVFAMPHVDSAQPQLVKVDCTLLVVGVDKRRAEEHRAEFIQLLDSYPQPERLEGGPSYIEVGAVIGDQGAAFQLFALGQVLGLWHVITPATLHVTDPQQARELAGSGLIMISGYKKGESHGSVTE